MGFIARWGRNRSVEWPVLASVGERSFIAEDEKLIRATMCRGRVLGGEIERRGLLLGSTRAGTRVALDHALRGIDFIAKVIHIIIFLEERKKEKNGGETSER